MLSSYKFFNPKCYIMENFKPQIPRQDQGTTSEVIPVENEKIIHFSRIIKTLRADSQIDRDIVDLAIDIIQKIRFLYDRDNYCSPKIFQNLLRGYPYASDSFSLRDFDNYDSLEVIVDKKLKKINIAISEIKKI